MKVLISDNLGEIGVKMFQEEEGIDVDVNTGLPPEELKKIIGEYDALVIRSATKVTEELLEAASNLKVVGRAGIGLDNVDIAAATKHGVAVMNTPGGNTVTTAEHAVAMMMALTRNIPQGTSSLKEERWDKKKLQGREVYNKTYGVIGFGNIGSIAADRARGLKMRVIVYDPVVTAEHIEKLGFECVTIEELYKQADYITIHVPKIKQTIGMINKDAFSQMKDGVMLINCARGGIINEADLYDAVKSGKVSGAALDVFETEPPGDSPLFELDNIICTPHLGASTREAQTNVAVAVAQQIIAYLKESTIINAVNVPSVTGDLLVKLSPFISIADRLGCLLSQLTEGKLQEITIEYSGEFHGLDLSPVSISVIKGLLTPMVADAVNSINAPILAKEMGIKISESTGLESSNYTNLITVKLKTTEMTNTVSGTIFGKNDLRVVKINDFRLEVVPRGYITMIHNIDKPGAIGSIGTILGENNINIQTMQVGQTSEGGKNIIVLQTDTPASKEVCAKLCDQSLVKSVSSFEL
ncbi:MAG: phosphoglycerate dehydrogenase [Desulfobacterales bacterium]|jgi:D-3-phosphoglycerate dehydrogenase / 2-oxoglutarate reductase|nr:phosphoglycerate dehydrogenase [Desulfobacteraceae bacterium]MBT4365285.1 phosphoglycerate dehydrogenase [Desulfobacteraceae bacterium]MBT7085385.1 phosphoglycerate dehydrogenase [Desulfobacterales bacterium]